MEGHVVGTVDTRCCFTWTIENFSFHTSDKLILSPEFPEDCNGKNWRLQLHPFGAYKDGDSEKLYVSLHLLLVSFVPGNQNDVNFQLSILNDQDERVHMFTARRIQFNTRVGIGGCCRYFITREDLVNDNRLLVDDRLRIHCKIWEMSVYDEPTCSHRIESLSSTFWNLRLDKKFVDFIVDVNGEEFHLHKAIMAVGSPVFASMLEHNTEETKNSRMTVTDCEPEIFEKFVRYLYLGTVDGLKNYDSGLLCVADKYGVDNLKHMCEKSLASNITVENAARVFMMAELHHASCLRNKSMEFIKKHLLEIINTESWKAMIISEPSLVNQVVYEFASSTKNREDQETSDGPQSTLV